MPSYPSDEAKFDAVLANDQNASGSFVFSYKNSNTYCRPTCHACPPIQTRSDVAFFPSSDSAKASGIKPCIVCNPDLPIQIDNSIIQQTVNTVNASLQLEMSEKSSPDSSNPSLSPQTPTEQLSNNPPLQFRHNRSSSLATCSEIDNEVSWRPRRASIASGHIAAVSAAVKEISRSANSRREDRHREGDHARLVNEACMHIAAAAAAAAAQAVNSKDEDVTKKGRANSSRNSSIDRTKQMFKAQRKKRRGGILGFKELAAKAGLSPWHFHRVFRSVTGLTPKAYGDACWNTVTSSISPSTLMAQKRTAQKDQMKSQLPRNTTKAPPKGFKQEAVAARTISSPKVSSNPGPTTTSQPPLYSSTRSSSDSVLSSPHENSLSDPTPPAPLDINSCHTEGQQRHQQLPFVSSPFISDEHSINTSTFGGTLMPTENSTPHSLYSSQSLESITTASSEDTQVMDSWSIPESFMDTSVPPSATVPDYDMLQLSDTWDDDSKPVYMPDLLSNDFKPDPTLSMMNLGNTEPSADQSDTLTASLDSVLESDELPTTTAESFMLDDDLHGKPLWHKTRLNKVKGGLGETLFDDDIENGSFAAAMAPSGMLTPTEPWMASPQPLLNMEVNDTVPPLLT